MLSHEEVINILAKVHYTDNKEKLLITRGLAEEQARRLTMQKEFSTLLSKIRALYSEETEIETIKIAVLQKIDEDINFINELNDSLKLYQGGTTVHWSLKNNKMLEVLLGAKQFVMKYFQRLVNKEEILPPSYNFQTSKDEITIQGKNASRQVYGHKTIYGNPKSTFLSTSLITTYLQKANYNNIADIPRFTELEGESDKWVDQSSIADIAPIPLQIDLRNFKHQRSTYLFQHETPQDLGFIHSGYAFGGHYQGRRHPTAKYLGAEDCATWLGRMTHTEESNISTLDLMNSWRLQEAVDTDLVPNGWQHTLPAQAALKSYEPVKVRLLKDIKAGYIWCCRYFNKGKEVRGHTGLVLGTRQNGETVALNYGRNIPKNVEGFGIGVFPSTDTIQEDLEMKVCFLKLK